MKLTQVDLFSGLGGFLLAGQRAGFTPLWGCEIEPFCRAVLAHHFPTIKIAEDIHDVRSFDRSEHEGEATWFIQSPTLLTGSFPIQANYSRGTRRENDPRSLWDEFIRVTTEARPTWVVAETIPRFSSLGLDDACWDLERAGYAVTAFVLPAQALDCPKRLERLFIVGASRDGSGLAYREPAETGDAGFEPWPAPGDRVHRVAVRFPAGMDQHVAALVALGDATIPRGAQVVLEHIAAVEREWMKDATDPVLPAQALAR